VLEAGTCLGRVTQNMVVPSSLDFFLLFVNRHKPLARLAPNGHVGSTRLSPKPVSPPLASPIWTFSAAPLNCGNAQSTWLGWFMLALTQQNTGALDLRLLLRRLPKLASPSSTNPLLWLAKKACMEISKSSSGPSAAQTRESPTSSRHGLAIWNN
jgi:hypothetical protein